MLSGKCVPIDLCNTELPQTSDSIKYSYLHSTVKGDMPVTLPWKLTSSSPPTFVSNV